MQLCEITTSDSASGWVDVKIKASGIYLGCYRHWISDGSVTVDDRKERRFYTDTVRQAKLALIDRYLTESKK